MAVWTLYCMYQPYWVCGFKGYLVHTTHLPPAVEWKIAFVAKFGLPCSHNRGRPCGRLWFHGSFNQNCMYHPYWVHGYKGYLVHIAHIPALLWNQNRVYGLVWDAVIATNEDVPVADYGFVAVWTLFCMYKPYWFCGSKGYLVHKAHIPPAMEFKVAYMAKFGALSFPKTRASIWQIMIWWQFGPYTVCTSIIGSVGLTAIWYIKLIYPLLWN